MSILIVDDSPHIHVQLKTFLNSGGYFDLFFAKTAAEACNYLGINAPKDKMININLILLDIMMPETDGINTCRRIKSFEHLQDIPTIIITADTSIKCLQEAFEAGAVDYITKPIKKIELISRIRSVLRLKHEIDSRKNREKELLELTGLLEDSNKKLQLANEKLHQMASIDGLTGIANRRHFDIIFEKEWNHAVRHSRNISIIMIDIDFFKAYNDTYGHQCGDECIKQITKTLKKSLKRKSDLLARYGGEEFVVLLPDVEPLKVVEIAEIMHFKVNTLKIRHANSQVSDHVTISMGIATGAPEKNSTFDSLIADADKALYEAKLEGRNCIRIFCKDTSNKGSSFI